MKKICLFILFTTQFIFAEATMKIANFVENGDGTVTFDIMILNDEDVSGLQWTLLSGEGVYDEAPETDDICQCTFECNDSNICNGVIPEGCDECYYDNGLDFVANAYEEGYYYSDPTNGCSESGDCADPSFSSSSDCEEAGICNGNGNSSEDDFCFINGIIEEQFTNQTNCEAAGLDGNGDVCDGTSDDCTALGDWDAYSSSNCTESGSCSNSNYINECDCVQNGGTWTSDGHVWSPTSLWTSYDLPYLCDENGNDWNYANQDASGDDYRQLIDLSSCAVQVNCGAFPEDPCCATEFQFCRMPGINSGDPSSSTTYQEYIGLLDVDDYDISGHCSQRDSYCMDLNDGGCSASGGLACDNGFPEGCCNNSMNPDWAWQSPYRDYVTCTENGFSWTAYDNQSTCEIYGGIWVGSENGTQGNDTYDLGENFIDTDGNLNEFVISNEYDGLYASEAGGQIIMFSLTGAAIPASTEYARVLTVTADITGDVDEIITLGARNICKDDYQLHCVSEMIIADANGDRMDADFIPTIWTIGSGADSADSAEAALDGICSLYAGETIETDSSCASICGDYYCDSATEDYVNCKMDCPDAVEGDGYCNLYEGENAGTTFDCYAFGCGDYFCDSDGVYSLESSSNCPADCLSYCGDGYCDIEGGENGINCSEDACGLFTLGDGICDNGGVGPDGEPNTEDDTGDYGENYCISPNDCATACGDNCYDHIGVGGVEDDTCADYQIVCGDGVYHYIDFEINEITASSGTAESYENCAVDYEQTCGDGYYDHSGTDTGGNETDSCDTDYISTLGDGVCDDSENPGIEAACTGSCGDGFYHHSGLDVPGDEEISCPSDYPADWDVSNACGDGICDGQLIGSSSTPDGNGENVFTCGSDCAGTGTCGDGYCDDIGLFGAEEDSTNCTSDCNPSCGDFVCARFDGGADTPASEDNQSCPDDCTFNMCGDGVCQSWWSEASGTTSAGTCDLDCSTAGDEECTFGEDDSASAWYSYDDCYSCGDGSCEEGFGETADPDISATFCFADCWTSCGDGVCDGPESTTNCYNEGIFSDPDAGGDGSWALDPSSEGDCLSIVENNVPLAYTLSNNYPNPFNPITTMSYSVKNAGNVKIDIYNILGQHIHTLVNSYHIPGALYRVSWDSANQSKVPISSGVYFYRMVSGSFEQEGRMTIVK